MPPFIDRSSEAVSFWLGFLSASVFWLILGRLRPVFTRLRAWLRERMRTTRKRGEERIREVFHHTTLNQAQAMHLAAPLFALDDVLIPSRLLAPPPAFIHPGPGGPDRIFHQVAPYLPDWPELASPLPAPTLTLQEVLQNGAPIAVTGLPGAGKTTALAELASQLARQTGVLAGRVPLLVSIFDLPAAEGTPDPLDRLIQFVAPLFARANRRQREAWLPRLAEGGQLVVLVDGLDELPPKELDAALGWLTALLTRYPKLICAVTAAFHQVGAVSKAGFLPLTLAGWNRAQVFEFVLRWSRQWQTGAAGSGKPDDRPVEIDPRMLAGWLAGAGNDPLTPLEWTLKTWSALAGDLGGARPQDAIEEHLRRCTQNRLPPLALAALAGEFTRQSSAALSLPRLEEALSKASFIPAQGDPGEPPAARDAKRLLRAKSGADRSTRAGQILQQLLDCELLIEDRQGLVRFSHPVIAGYLAASAPGLDPQVNLSTGCAWTTEMEATRWLAARSSAGETVMRLLERDRLPFFPGLMSAARWLKDAPAQAAWRPALMRRLLSALNDETLALSQRGRLIAAFVAARDPSVPLVFKQLLGSKDPVLRQLLALGLGAFGSAQFIGELVNLLADADNGVRCAACLALAGMEHPTATEALLGALYEGDETLQQAAAEALAGKPSRGAEILKEALKSEGLMARRAAVTGISLFREPWARNLLEKISVEDAQWSVRTSAALALKAHQEQTGFLPVRLPPPSDSAWLIAFASKRGVGVPADRFPGELLLDALREGALEERLGALLYLRDVRSEPITTELQSAACSQPPALREAALYSLWLRT